jgi:hypothetical protein
MARQDRQSGTTCSARENKRRTATIAPLVVLKVARSGTPPLQRPLRGSLGCSPAPGLLRPGDVLHVVQALAVPFAPSTSSADARSRRSTITPPRKTRRIKRKAASLDVSVEVIERNGSELCCKQLVVECVQCFANRLMPFNSCVIGLVTPSRPEHPAITSRRLPRAFRRRKAIAHPRKSMNRSM